MLFATRTGENINVYKVLVGKRKIRRPVGRHKLRRKDNIKMGVKEIGCWSVHWVNLA
jgi:hypothetical protein